MAGIMDPSAGNGPTWTPAFNPYSGHGHYNPFAGWSFWPFGGGDQIPDAQGAGANDSNAQGIVTIRYGSDSDMPLPQQGGIGVASPGSQVGPISPQNDPTPPSPGDQISPGIAAPTPPATAGPSTTPGSPPPQATGSQVSPPEPVPPTNPSQPAPQQDAGGGPLSELAATADWAWNVGSEGFMGGVQGGANTVNGVQDGAIGMVNLLGFAYNYSAGLIPGAPRAQYIPSPDWSDNLVRPEDPTAHAASKFLGGTGVTMLVPGGQFKMATAGLGRVQALAQAANGTLVPITRTVVVAGTRTVAIAAPGVAGAAGIGVGNVVQMSTAGGNGGGPNAPSSVKNVLDGLPGKTGKTGPIKNVSDEQALDNLFNSLSSGGKTIDPGTYPGIVKELPDGTIVRMRPSSRSGGATIDITLPGGTIYKVHIGS
jgi:hypothetical protein